jgi:hypothetical protein
MRRIVTRILPSGEFKSVQPFHVCIKGAETAVHCRDEEDYDVYVKYIALCARRKNVIVIIYAVVSNHCHVAVLAAKQADADAFAQELATLPREKKLRIVPYLWRTRKTTVSQLARVMGMGRDEIEKILGIQMK